MRALEIDEYDLVGGANDTRIFIYDLGMDPVAAPDPGFYTCFAGAAKFAFSICTATNGHTYFAAGVGDGGWGQDSGYSSNLDALLTGLSVTGDIGNVHVILGANGVSGTGVHTGTAGAAITYGWDVSQAANFLTSFFGPGISVATPVLQLDSYTKTVIGPNGEQMDEVVVIGARDASGAGGASSTTHYTDVNGNPVPAGNYTDIHGNSAPPGDYTDENGNPLPPGSVIGAVGDTYHNTYQNSVNGGTLVWYPTNLFVNPYTGEVQDHQWIGVGDVGYYGVPIAGSDSYNVRDGGPDCNHTMTSFDVNILDSDPNFQAMLFINQMLTLLGTSNGIPDGGIDTIMPLPDYNNAPVLPEPSAPPPPEPFVDPSWVYYGSGGAGC